MNKQLQEQKDETLHDWCMRISQSLNMTQEQTDALIEVSKQSYIKGSNDARLVLVDDNPTMHY